MSKLLQQAGQGERRNSAFGREDASRGIFLIVLLSLCFLAWALSSFSSHYQTNDDAAMNMYAAGKGLGQPPSEFLLFQHFIIGLVLKFLYTHFPEIPWYGALLYSYLFLSSVVVGYVISRWLCRFNLIGLWTVLFVLFYLQVLVSPQFTICAGYLAIAGILLLYATIYKPYSSKRAELCFLIIASALLVLAGLIRFYSLLLGLLVVAPLYLYALITQFALTVRRLLPVLCCVALISCLLQRAQLAYYERSPGWEKFYTYNNVRADFIDRNKIAWDKNTAPLFRQIGWSQNDLAMLMSWFYLDPQVYSSQNLLFISQRAGSLPRPRVAWKTFFSDLRQSLLSYGGLAGLFLCVLLLTKGSRLIQGFAIIALAWYGILFLGITIVERHLPPRVWLVMLLGFYVTELILWCHVSDEQRREDAATTQRLRKPILTALAVLFCVFCCLNEVRAVGKISDGYAIAQRSFEEDITQLHPRASQLFVTWGGDFPYQFFQLPTHAEPLAREMRVLGLGVGNHEPFVQNQLRSFGIDDLYQSLYTRPDIFLICRDEKKKFLVRYIREHYKTKVAVDKILRGRKFTVRKVRKLI